MTPMIFANAVRAAVRAVEIDPGVRQGDGGACRRQRLAEAITSQFAGLANAGGPFLTHLVE